MQLTKGGEAGAYFLAVGITFGASYLLGPAVISPFYAWLRQTHGTILVSWAIYGIDVVTWLVTLLLFLLLRRQFDGVPAIVTSYDPERPAATFWAEIVAYVTISVVIQALSVVSTLVTALIHVSLQQNGHANLLMLVAIAERALAALIFFALFVLLRGLILSKRTE